MLKIVQLFLLISLLSACASGFQPHADPITELKAGNYTQAEQAISQRYSSTGRNQLLYHLEMGMLKHLQGQYLVSNQHFDKAEDIGEKLFTTRLTEEVSVLLTGPNLRNYKGFVFENTYINYYKALNYLKLAEQEAELDQAKLDAALVEVRRLAIRLNELKHKTGGYQAPRQPNREATLAYQILQIFKQSLGRDHHVDKFVYRDDAFAHYMSGILYEMSGELDSARIEYTQAAQSYENGFAQQYKLGNQGLQQVWFDVAKTMTLAGGYQNELDIITNNKLNNQQRAQLASLTPESTDIIVIQHAGTAPKRQNLNMLLRIDKDTKSLVLTPIVTGSYKERQAQWRWFEMLYADTDIIDILQNYALGDLGNVVMGQFTKRIPLSFIWDDVKRLGLLDALQIGARISVPYYPPPEQKISKTQVWLNGQLQGELMPASSIARIALQEQLRIANSQIQAALVRELVKALMAQKAIKEVGLHKQGIWGDLAKIATATINAINASADTRNWLSLPANINFKRIPVKAGLNQIKLVTYFNSGQINTQSTEINVKPERPSLWHVRTFADTPISNHLNKSGTL
ncbi:hypothetical protein HR060_11150 [Catenovulum sp. SM1970]|uniref:hypothetical protein n=1 Tax=Marinifaba aquimaris TaxID=2741323 RepID=UPI0015745A97|nr:hypothetical protein [Marinifaba aquimaris]NTS77417.1 hypothetical protein [Marinifaba aquimaris]